MKVIIDILRRNSAQDQPRRQRIPFVYEEENLTVALALRRINAGGFKDESGADVEPVRWEEGCGQKKCGACAMLINGEPALACDSFLKDCTKRGRIVLAPLKKFPVVADLLVDRSVMMKNLKTLKIWANEAAAVSEKELDNAYEASLCLQCGCCLEACPNYFPEGKFLSAAAFAPQARLLSKLPEEEKKGIRKLYFKHIYEGCGKALACEKVCPAELPLDSLLSRSNALKIWKKR